MLATAPAALQPRRIAAALAGHAIGCEVQVHDVLASTSDWVRDLGFSGYPHGLVVFAEEQTAGRGRRESRWHSEPGRDLLCSVLLRPTVPIHRWPRLTTLAALAICKAIETTAPLTPMIKWPNDVLLHGRKCAGILAETFTLGHGAFMALGIGLNVNTDTYPRDLHPTATSLKLQLHRDVDRSALAIALLKQIGWQVQRWDDPYADVVAEVRRRSWLLGQAVTARVEGRTVQGVASDLDSEGHLVLREHDGRWLTLTSAEQVRPVAAEPPVPSGYFPAS